MFSFSLKHLVLKMTYSIYVSIVKIHPCRVISNLGSSHDIAHLRRLQFIINDQLPRVWNQSQGNIKDLPLVLSPSRPVQSSRPAVGDTAVWVCRGSCTKFTVIHTPWVWLLNGRFKHISSTQSKKLTWKHKLAHLGFKLDPNVQRRGS